MKKIILGLVACATILSSCKKDQDPPLVCGCTDKNSPFKNADAEIDDGSCKYLYVTELQVRAFPEEDGSQKWDALAIGNERKADLYLLLKPTTATSYNNYFESRDNEISNATFTDVHSWTTPTQFKLNDANWGYELWDKDGAFAGDDDEVATGTFNPVTSYDKDNNWIDVFHTNGTHIRIKTIVQQ